MLRSVKKSVSGDVVVHLAALTSVTLSVKIRI